jgi:hypothetical protein
MTTLTRSMGAGLLLAASLVMPVRLDAQASLAAARQLYSSAEYDGALAMLNTLRDLALAEERASIEFYRALCLLAVGETSQATEAVGLMVARDPFYRPAVEDVPPRLRPVVSDARKKSLPGVVQSHYVRAKTAYERGDFKAAKDLFTQVLAQLNDPDLSELVAQSPLSDLRLLASGFNELSTKALVPPAPAAPPAAAAAAPPQVTASQVAAPQAVPPAAPSAAPQQAVVAPAAGTARPAGAPTRVFGAEDADVSAPVVVRQVVPGFPGRILTTRTGIVEVVITEAGAVEAATMIQALDPGYDRSVLAAARSWTYMPARRSGVPVKYRKRIQITLSPNGQ